MFFFGSPRDATDMFYDEVVAGERDQGFVPEMPRNAADEMTEKELRTALTWVFYSHRRAEELEMAQEVIDQIEKDYVEIICALAVAVPKYAYWASSPTCRHINLKDKKKKRLYRQLIVTACIEAGEDTYYKEDTRVVAAEDRSAD